MAQTSVWPAVAAPDHCPAAAPFVREQIEREGVFPGFDVRQGAGAIDDGPHHLLAGGISQRMDDAMVAVPTFAPQGQRAGHLVEVRAPLDQLVDPRRRLANDHLDDFRVAQLAADGQRVGNVIFEAVFRVDDAGDATLGIVAIGLAHAALGDHQHRLLGRSGQRRPQTG